MGSDPKDSDATMLSDSLEIPFQTLSLDEQPAVLANRTPSTIDTLSIELLLKIFSLACEGEYRIKIKPNSCPSQHILMLVCRRWHSTVYASSTSRLIVSYLDPSSYQPANAASPYSSLSDLPIPSCHRRFLRTALQLCRSTFHCSIHVYGNNEPTPLPTEVIAILAEIVSASNRWFSLELDLRHVSLQFLLPIQHKIPYLRSIVLKKDLEMFIPEPRDFISLIFSDAPNLTVVEAEILDIGYEFPWTNLEEITLAPQSCQQWAYGAHVNFVSYLRNILKSIRLRRFVCVCPFEYSNHWNVYWPAPITYPTILDFCVENPTGSFLRHLILPAVTIISFHFEREVTASRTNEFIQSFLPFLERSNCSSNISSFGLSHPRPTPIFKTIHMLLPNLQRLQTRLFSFTTVFDFLNLLRASDFFPVLEELDVIIAVPSGCIVGLAMEAMLRRLVTVVSQRAHLKLKHVDVSIDGSFAGRSPFVSGLAGFETQSVALAMLKELGTPMVDVRATFWRVDGAVVSARVLDLLISKFYDQRKRVPFHELTRF